MDPESGGLVVYTRMPPADWDSEKINNMNRERQREMREYLEREGAEVVTVPYRQNRMVMFHSKLFHKTDEFHFRRCYTCRRVNITLLFSRMDGTGDRGVGEAKAVLSG